MARFDVYRLAGRGEARFVLDVQADILDELGTRIVVPLLISESGTQASKETESGFRNR